MTIFSILWNSAKIFITSVPVIGLFFMSWLSGIPNKSINALNPVWHISLLIQQSIYLNLSLAYTPSRMLFMTFSTIERIIYSLIYWRYSNKDKQIEYQSNRGFFSLFTNVLPYAILNSLIALSFFVFYTDKASSSKTDNALFYSGFMMSSFSVFLVVYKGLELFYSSPCITNLNTVLFADILSFLGLSIMNFSNGNFTLLLVPIINFLVLRKSLGRNILTKESDFVTIGDYAIHNKNGRNLETIRD